MIYSIVGKEKERKSQVNTAHTYNQSSENGGVDQSGGGESEMLNVEEEELIDLKLTKSYSMI